MREFLFRAKKTGTLEWVEGFVASPIVFVEQSTGTKWFVDDCTVGQYTGLTDKNGKKIFEGDIVEIEHSIRHYGEDDFTEAYRPRRSHSWHWDDKQQAFLYKRNYVVEWKEKDARWILRNGSDQHNLVETYLHFHNGVIIGNIHDNPELLKGE